jgi:hypothetical protein
VSRQLGFTRIGGDVNHLRNPFCQEKTMTKLKRSEIRDLLNRPRPLRLAGIDLSNADLKSADLRGADLKGANLSHASMMRAKLDKANLTGANLDGAFLRGANLSKANLSEASLSEADLYDANLTEAKLRGANLSDADLAFADLTDAKVSSDQLASAKSLKGALGLVYGEEGARAPHPEVASPQHSGTGRSWFSTVLALVSRSESASPQNLEDLQAIEHALVTKRDWEALQALKKQDSPEAAAVAARVLKVHYVDENFSTNLVDLLIKMGHPVDVEPLCDALDYYVSQVMSTRYGWDSALVNLPEKMLVMLRTLFPSGEVKGERLITSLTRALSVPNMVFRGNVEAHLLEIGSDAVPVMKRLVATPDETWPYILHDEPVWQDRNLYRLSKIPAPVEAVEEIKRKIEEDHAE